MIFYWYISWNLHYFLWKCQFLSIKRIFWKEFLKSFMMDSKIFQKIFDPPDPWSIFYLDPPDQSQVFPRPAWPVKIFGWSVIRPDPWNFQKCLTRPTRLVEKFAWFGYFPTRDILTKKLYHSHQETNCFWMLIFCWCYLALTFREMSNCYYFMMD